MGIRHAPEVRKSSIVAYADRLSAPLPGRLPSEFLRPPVLPSTTVTASRNSVGRLDGTPAVPRRAAAEVRLPCMVYAAVGVLPGRETADVDRALAETRKAPGVVHVITYAGVDCSHAGIARPEVAVVARGYWLARHALARLMEKFGGPSALSAASDADRLACPSRITRGTAHFVEGRLRLWVATSDMEATRALAARLAAIPEQYVDLRIVGEAEGAAPIDILTAALALARELQPAPVQVIVAPVVTVPLPAAPRAPEVTPVQALAA